MLTKPIAEVNESDLRALIDVGVTESKTLEFKRELPDTSNSGKVKFLRSVTAFANTNGGDLIYGMSAVDGIARELVPLAMPSRDHVLQRLENLCADGVEPRLSGVAFHWVTLSGGGHALLIRVARSWNAPHRVTAGDHSHFYSRNSAGNSPMDVTELRRAFVSGGELTDRIRAFREGRLFTISAGQAPMRLRTGAICVLHVIPIQAFTTDRRIDVASGAAAINQIHPMGASGYNDRLNLDGRLTYRNQRDDTTLAYAQLFRNGIIESVSVHAPYDGGLYVGSLAYERDILRALNSYLPALNTLQFEPPVFVFFSLVGVNGYRLGVGTQFFASDGYAADRDVLAFPEVQVSDWSTKPESVMRPIFDMVWNAFGYQRSFNYTENGEWQQR